MTGSPRVVLSTKTPKNYAALRTLQETVASGAAEAGLESVLVDLVNTRASQINGCAFCLDMHTKEARENGESEQRLHALVAWRESPFFTRRERAGLALTEAVTLIHGDQLPDEVYSAAEAEFDGDELSQLLWVIIVINSLNRVAISSRLRPARS